MESYKILLILFIAVAWSEINEIMNQMCLNKAFIAVTIVFTISLQFK